MVRELYIKHKNRNRGSMFSDDFGNLYDNSELFGRTTNFPGWYKGLTREIDGHTWWIIQSQPFVGTGNPQSFRHYGKNNEDFGECSTYTMPIHYLATPEQRAMIDLTPEEAKLMGFPYISNGVAVRDDSEAWEVFLGNIPLKKHMSMPISLTVKIFDDKIDNFLYHTLPARKARKEKLRKERDKAKREIKSLDNVPIPKLRTGRNANNSTYLHAKLLGGIVHNLKALELRQDSIIEELEQKTGEFGHNQILVSLSPSEIHVTSDDEFNIDVVVNTSNIPIKTLDIRIDYPMGFTINSIDYTNLFGQPSDYIDITKSQNGITYIAMAKLLGVDITPLDGILCTLKLRKSGAIPNTYNMPIINAQFIANEIELVKKKIITQGTKIIVE